MTAADVLRTGSLGLRTRRTRAALSALGIAIGVASMVAVLGISESS
jgi:putative ABC transport system permease protein